PSRRSKIGWNAACTSNSLATPARDPEGLLTDAFNPNAVRRAALFRADVRAPTISVNDDDRLSGDSQRLVLRVLFGRAHQRDPVAAVVGAGRELVHRHALQPGPRARDPAVERARL